MFIIPPGCSIIRAAMGGSQNETVLTLDGSAGEGGGQILRTALAMSLVTGTPFRIVQIRAKRSRPGLMRQHLAAVQAAAKIGQAEVRGAEIGSTELTFRPGQVVAGDYNFAVGTAGSATLVLQTVLPALLRAPSPSSLVLEGGTHNPFAPPFDFLDKAFLPLLNRMGPRIEARLERPGFYPAGGGRFTVRIEPAPRLSRLDLPERGAIRRCRARAIVSRLPRGIAERELAVIRKRLAWNEEDLRVEEVANPFGPGNAVIAEIESENVTEVFAAFGERGVRAEAVAEALVAEAREYLDGGAPVGRHLADQLLIPLALAGGGAFHTLEPSSHTRTNLDVIGRFLDVKADCARVGPNTWRIEIVRK